MQKSSDVFRIFSLLQGQFLITGRTFSTFLSIHSCVLVHAHTRARIEATTKFSLHASFAASVIIISRRKNQLSKSNKIK